MVSQEQAPLTQFWNLRRLLQDFRNRLAVFELQRHEHPWHERKMKCHVELVTIAEICPQITGPLVRFRQQHPSGKLPIKPRAQLLDDLVGFREVLAIRPLAFYKVV